MATLKVELSQSDIMVAVQQYVEREFGVSVTNGVKLDIARGVVDRPGMDAPDSVCATVVVNASPMKKPDPTVVVYCECNVDSTLRAAHEVEENCCDACSKPFKSLLSNNDPL